VTVAAVRPRSPAAAAGLASGDRIVAVNGHRLRDVIDFHFHAGHERLELAVERHGVATSRRLDRRGADLGLELAAPRPGDIATCANKCVFCFIHQLPKGMRKSLYVKDDDFRLSFLHGNYITLRHALLGRPRHSAEILPRLERLAKAGIRMHAQIVLCPDLNDGAHLERTVFELAPLYPQVATTAIVPVGLTRHRERLPALRSLTPSEARALVGTTEGWQRRWRAQLGSRFVFLADEIYLLAGLSLPTAAAYEGFPIVEDGIGLVRRFEDGFARAVARGKKAGAPSALTVVTGEMFAPRLSALLRGAGIAPAVVRVTAIPNDFFGSAIGVAGLLTGRDIQRRLATRPDLGRAVLVPAVALRDADGVFLDDLTPADLARDLGVPVRVVAPTPGALLKAIRNA
jgi:NifB/MoaA-like Fe-S oxidoreductase